MNNQSKMTSEMLDALTSYVDVLAAGTNYANDRPMFDHHLARAAEMFSAFHKSDMSQLRQLVDFEIRYYGQTYIRSPQGDAVAKAWERFGKLVQMVDNQVS